ncbi:MAG: lysophospholipase L1-like esterase [Bacteroidia bacterium]|jgi:lysophospholipase L1-like esterase
MKNKGSALILCAILFGIAALLCPMLRSIAGFGIDSSTIALQIYYWTASTFFFLLGLLSIPRLPKLVGSILKTLMLVVLLSSSIEFASAVAYKVLFGQWSHSQYMNLNRYMFQSHPYLVGSLIKGANHQREELLYAHNSLGYRGAEFTKAKPVGKIRIATIGGSTTYGVGVNNEGTWPYQLGGYLGQDYQVINMGVPGYTSAENLIQTALQLSDYEPDLAIYFIGLNDLRNINVKDLEPDYSDYHAPALYGALGLCSNENVPALASIKMALIMGQRAGLIEGCPNQSIQAISIEHQGVDARALSLYERNLKNIKALCNQQGVKVLFVPQILMEDVLKTGNYNWWIPYVPTSEMDDMMVAYNEVLKNIADSTESDFAAEVLNHPWKKSDFVDMSHFTSRANGILAEILAGNIRQEFESDSVSQIN